MPTNIFVTKVKRATGYGLLPAHESDQDAIKSLPNGQPLRVKITRVRNYEFHKKYFALLNYAFDIWEPPEEVGVEKQFDRFRKDIAILCGFYETVWRLDGTFRVEPKSISFSKMDEDEFEKLYNKTIEVICEHVLKNYSGDELRRVMEQIESFE